MAKRNIRKSVESNGHLKSWLPQNLSEKMVFETPEPVEVPVDINGEEYILTEADEAAAIAYRNAHLRAIKFSQEGDKVKVSGTEGTAETRSLLVSLCLYRVCKDKPSEMERVSLDDVRAMKPNIVKALFDRIKAISQIEEDEQETAEVLRKRIRELTTKLEQLESSEERSKNLQPDTTPTSG